MILFQIYQHDFDIWSILNYCIYCIDRYNVELCKLEYEENDAVRAIKNFALSKPELRKLLVGKRLKSNEKEIYNDLERLNDSSTQFVHFPLIDWTNKDVENFFNSLFLPYYTIKS